jgi:hypothetical protein
MRSFYIFVFACLSFRGFTQTMTTKFELSGGTQTPTYQEIISWWKNLDAASPLVKMMQMGPTDAGFPLHLVLISGDRDFDLASIRKKNKRIVFFNNGIHPGEPDGIDASMLLARDIAINKYKLPSNVVIALIPVYNIGGCLNRSDKYRVDQDGPEEFGFRGNSQNLDLNRDFIKCDSKEAFSFTKIFHLLNPDVFVDNHVSDGADYQHVMTLIASQHNKLGGDMGVFMNQQFEPGLYALMKEKGYDLVPYVNHFGDTPEKGWSEFWDSPRYSSGYASLWNTFSFIPETHMLKPYRQRVESTKALMQSFIEFTSTHSKEISDLRTRAVKEQQNQKAFPLAWKLDRGASKQIVYKGYTAGYKKSGVSGLPRLFYDRSKPFEITVPFYDVYVDTLSVTRPEAYIIPQGWWKVIERLQANGIQMRKLTSDTSVEVEWYKLTGYTSGQRQFEGHHLNTDVRVSKNSSTINFRKGDFFIPMNQAGNRFIIETLEPQAEDSYFTWNFFDPVLGQKEGYSDYHFEDIAAEYLNNNTSLKAKLDERRAADSAFAKNAGAQLNFVFQNSPWFEPAYLRYPVYRVIK